MHKRGRDDPNPVIVFEDGNQSDQDPIEIGYRQPSFIQLQGKPIPKGFDSIDDFKALRAPTRVDPYMGDSRSMSIQSLLRKRNAQKWEQMGYNPKTIENSLNRQSTDPSFSQGGSLLNDSNNGLSSSFSQIDSIKPSLPKITELPLDVVYEEEYNDPKPKLLRSLSSGEEIPMVELPAPPSVDDDPYTDDDYSMLKLDEYGYPIRLENVCEIAKNTLVYKIICGRKFQDLPHDVANLIADDLHNIAMQASEAELVNEAFYVQNTIDNIRRTSSKVCLEECKMKPEYYKKCLREVTNQFEKAVDYWDTQEFLYEDAQRRAARAPVRQGDDFRKIDRTRDRIVAGRREAFEDLKAAVEQLRAGRRPRARIPLPQTPLPAIGRIKRRNSAASNSAKTERPRGSILD